MAALCSVSLSQYVKKKVMGKKRKRRERKEKKKGRKKRKEEKNWDKFPNLKFSGKKNKR
jgi:hypothetical protein